MSKVSRRSFFSKTVITPVAVKMLADEKKKELESITVEGPQQEKEVIGLRKGIQCDTQWRPCGYTNGYYIYNGSQCLVSSYNMATYSAKAAYITNSWGSN